MRFVQRRAEMHATAPNGVSNRAAWRASARNGNPDAMRKLQWPRYPKTLAYLDDWHAEISAGRGDSANGIAPLTWRDVESWAAQTGKRLKPHEVTALVQLDRVFVTAVRGASETQAEVKPSEHPDATPVVVTPSWPSKQRET